MPLTTSSKSNPYYVNAGVVDGKQAYAIISQIRLIDVKRLTDKLSIIDEVTFNNIRKTVRELF